MKVILINMFLKCFVLNNEKHTVITVSRHDLDDHKKYGVATDLFYSGVIGHPGHMFLN